MIRTLASTTAAVLALAACAPTERAESDQRALAEARAVGEPVDCVDLPRISHTRVRDDRNIDFHMRGGEVYRNTLPYACPGLHFDDAFSYETSLGRLCSTDMITVTRGGGVRGATCGLGRFQRIEAAAR